MRFASVLPWVPARRCGRHAQRSSVAQFSPSFRERPANGPKPWSSSRPGPPGRAGTKPGEQGLSISAGAGPATAPARCRDLRQCRVCLGPRSRTTNGLAPAREKDFYKAMTKGGHWLGVLELFQRMESEVLAATARKRKCPSFAAEGGEAGHRGLQQRSYSLCEPLSLAGTCS